MAVQPIPPGMHTVTPHLVVGDRYGVLEDPFGHSWAVATHVRDVSPAEIAAAAKKGM